MMPILVRHLLFLALCLTSPLVFSEEPPPNIIVVVADDLRFDEYGAGGHTYLETPHIDRLAAEGAQFANAFHVVPLCSPNRASILTGQYPSRHGIFDNVARNIASHALKTYPQALQSEGYRTAFFGKWHMGNDPTPRPGFDVWAALPGQGRSEDPELFENGKLQVVPGYTSDILTERAVDFIRENRNRLFAIHLAHKAVHPDVAQLDDGSVDPTTSRGFVAAPRHVGRYEGEKFEFRANTLSTLDDLEGKPVVRRALAKRADLPTGTLNAAQQQVSIRQRAEMVLAIDEGVGRILQTLEETNLTDNTVVMFTSDNGYFFGEHGLLLERRMPYEEAIRNPLLIRYPDRIAAGSRPEGLTLSVDIAPTILDLAGVTPGSHVQGRSLVPQLTQTDAPWRDAVLIEFYTYDHPFTYLADLDYRAIRSDRYKYVHWVHYPDEPELYDLQADPLEQKNLASDPKLANVRQAMEKRLQELVIHAIGLTRED